MSETPSDYRRLENSERRPIKGAVLLGPADKNEVVKVTIMVRRLPDGPRMPEADFFLKTPPVQRQRMAGDEFAAKYGAADEDLAKVAAFAREHRLNVIETNAVRRTVIVSGTVAHMNKAFGVSLGSYEHKVVRRRGQKPQTERYRGRDGFIHVPEALQGIIEGVFGLDNRNITRRNSADPPNTTPLTTQTITGLYDFPTNSAAGQTIGIVSAGGGYLAADINTTFGGSPPTITDVSINGTGNSNSADGETTQDICIAGLAAPGADIAVYFQDGSQSGWVDMLQKIAHPSGSDPICSVISSSFYISDGDDSSTLSNEGLSTAFIDAISAAFHDAAIQGVTVCIASGDTGSSSKVGGNPSAWGYGFAADGKAHVQYPGSDPWVLAVGGTTIGNVIGATFDEYVWNDPNPSDPQNWGTTGGGISDHFDLPSYQNGVGVPHSVNGSRVGRGVPDVAANASLNSGYSGLTVGGGSFTGNGTSASSPLWAGLIAVINAALGENVGFVNPLIYALGSSFFRDIVPGAGPADNSNSGVTGYPAGPGWDACTGWGSINGKRLLAGLQARTRPAIAVDLEHGLAFGTVCQGPQYLTLEIYNVGAKDLVINSVQRLMGSTSFTVLSTPSTPLVVAPGEDIEFTVVYNPNPAAAGITETATIRISSNDPTAPFVDLSATGLLGTASLVFAIADNGNIGSVCLGSFAEEELTIDNTGSCPLSIANISSSSAEFIVPNVVTYPLVVSPGASLAVTIRFQPTSFGAKSATFTLVSNDPASPGTVNVSGVALAPRLNSLVSDYGGFGDVCIGSFEDEPLILTNSGECTLSISNISSSSSEFLVPQVSAYPVTIAAGVSLEVPIRFQPTSFGPKSATITVTSDDPVSPQTITVSGNAPSGKVAVTGSACFGGVQAYCCADRTISICNVGDCNLNVTSVAFKRKSHHWKLINNPFPATLHPGSCLGVAILYKATEKYPRCMELVITSDDPNTPVKTLDVMAYTIWSDCGCKQCCEDCRKGCCEKNHKESCCCEGRQGYPCCDDDEDEEKTDSK
jgi:hypothetical protein